MKESSGKNMNSNLPKIPTDNSATCPLCQTEQGELFYEDNREYFRCSNCFLIYVLPCYFLSSEDEKKVYDQHQNSPEDLGYRQFLSKLFIPMSQELTASSHGLDFGSGPGPTLSVMFEESGHFMKIYDPYYAPDTTLLTKKYDFVTATEVIEHFCFPRMELERMWSCLKPGGMFGIMTKCVCNREAFSRWYYKNDPTHVCFYSMKTFYWLAKHWSAEIKFLKNDVVIFKKNRGTKLSYD